jgi:glutathione peroxidase
MSDTIYQIALRTLAGADTQLADYQGKTMIILNVASECGYTEQYTQWQYFYEQNQNQGFVVLGFPCNQFGGQEPGSSSEIADFCQKNFGVTFPLFEKSDVKGAEQSPLFQWLTDPTANGWNSQVPTWNFCKYIINPEGKLTHFFESDTTPEHPDFLKAIGKLDSQH